MKSCILIGKWKINTTRKDFLFFFNSANYIYHNTPVFLYIDMQKLDNYNEFSGISIIFTHLLIVLSCYESECFWRSVSIEYISNSQEPFCFQMEITVFINLDLNTWAVWLEAEYVNIDHIYR